MQELRNFREFRVANGKATVCFENTRDVSKITIQLDLITHIHLAFIITIKTSHIHRTL